VVALAVIGVGAFLTQSSPAFWAPLYSRLRARGILDLKVVAKSLTTSARILACSSASCCARYLGSGNLYYHLQVLEREG